MLFHFLTCTAFALLSLPLANTTPQTLVGGRALQARDPKGQGSNQAASRAVLIFFGIKADLKDDWSNANKWPAHSFLWIDGDANNGAVKIEIVLEDPNTGQPTLRYLEFAKGSKAYAPDIGTFLKKFPLGQTSVQNADLLNQQKNGAGILMDAVNQDATCRVGPTHFKSLNSCHDVLTKIVARADGIQITKGAQEWMTFYDNWTKTSGTDIDYPIKYIRKWAAGATKEDNKLAKSFTTKSCTKKKRKRDTACPTPTDDENKAVKPGQLEVAACDRASTLPPHALTIDSMESFSDKVAPPDVLKDSRTTIAKVAGELRSYVTLAKPALEALGWAGSAIGAAFVIIDLVDKKWVGVAVGGIGLAAGVAAGVAISGPVGWIIGGLISAFFAILPGAIGHTKEPPNRANIQQIIQFKLFGDAKHTGNEKCRKDTKDYKGNPDCQALYGAGTLSMALQMTNFDTVLFLSQFNDGYPMTIPDIAKHFYVIDDRKHDDGKDKMAIVDCNLGRSDWYSDCLKPSFKLNRKLFHIPGISDTAEKVFDQIAPKGDCKLITFPGDAYYATIDLTLNGLPSRIACGVPDKLHDGTAVPADVIQNPDNGFARAPEPAVPFANLAQEKYACLFHGGNGPFCLPPGTYQKQSGVGFEIVKVDSLTLPNEGKDGAWSLQAHYKTPKSGHTQQTIDRKYGHNEDPKRKSSDWQFFSNDMHGIHQENDPAENHFTIIGPGDGPDPVCCLFSKPSFGGNVWCTGVGGGNVPPRWKDVAQSVSCHAGAQAYIYADHYNDLGGALITHNVEDLKEQLYDNKSKSFSKNLKAIWIFKP